MARPLRLGLSAQCAQPGHFIISQRNQVTIKRFNYLTLAALVALAACDEGVDPVVAPVTGTIVGAVTIEAEAAAGVSVTLSSGPTATTDAEGAFQFDEVATGCTR